MTYSFRTNGNFIDFVHTDNTSLQVESVLRSLHNTSRAVSWSLSEDTTRISFKVDDIEVKDFPISEIDFDGTAMNSQDDFETGITAMFTGLDGGGGGGSSYLVYTAFLMQTGTDTITSVELQNTIDVPLSLSNFGTGAYLLSGFGRTLYQIAIPPFGNFQGDAALYLPLFNGSSQVGWYSYFYDPDSFGGCIDIGTHNLAGAPTNLSDLIGDTGAIFIEVRAYS